jgi:hypothetical protein
MHDEDSAIGLNVTNAHSSWKAYGDKRLLDKEDGTNTLMALSGLRTSVEQVYNSWKTQTVPSADDLQAAFEFTPNLATAQAYQDCAPLFTTDGAKRTNINDRRTWQFTTNWWWATTVSELLLSNRWAYPITL